MVIRIKNLLTVKLEYISALAIGFLLFFFLYGIDFTFLPLSTARIIVLAGAGYILLSITSDTSIILRRSFVFLLMLYFVLLSWIAFITFVYDLKDITILTGILLMFAHSFIGGYFFAMLFNRFEYDFRSVILFIQVAITIQAVFIIIYFLSWDFREFTFSYIPETGNIDYRENLFQSRGLTHSSGAALSVLQSLGVLFTSYLLSTVSFKSKQFLYLSLSFGLLCISIFLTGRTGFLMLPLVGVYFFMLMVFKLKIPKNVGFFILIAPLMLLVSYFTFRYVYNNFFGGITTAGGEDILSRVFRWYIEEFYSDGRLQSKTFTFLTSTHLFFPEDNSVLLFGDPTTWSLNRIRSDIGLVRMWHGIGLLGIILYYSFIIALFMQMILSSRGFNEKLMLSLLLLFLFIIEFKEPFMFSVSVNAFFILIFSYMFLNNIRNGVKL
ncbi:MAG: hypothetical protein ACOCWM_00750 [Cyclobacteriaceae bacterium]